MAPPCSKRWAHKALPTGLLILCITAQLGIASAPVVFNHPATEGDRKPASGNVSPVKYDFAEYVTGHHPLDFLTILYLQRFRRGPSR